MVTTRSSHADGETATKRNASETGTSPPARKQRKTSKEDELSSGSGPAKTESNDIQEHINEKDSDERNQGNDEQQHANGKKDESTGKLGKNPGRGKPKQCGSRQ